MKILQLVTARQYRGAEVAAAAFTKEFIRQGHTVIFAGLYPPPVYALMVENALIIDIGAKKGFFSIAGFYRLWRLVQKEKPEILHANGSDTLKYLVFIKLLKPSIPLLYRNISVISHWRGKNRFKNLFYNFLMKRVDFVTSVGVEAKEDFIKTFKLNPSKITVVRRGIALVDEPIYSKAHFKNLAGISEGEYVLVHIGNFSPEKDHDFLIDSFVVIKNIVKNVRLILIGEGQLQDKIKNRVTSLHLESNVLFANLQTEIGPFLQAADLVLLVSKVEGVPGVLLEAAAHQVPSVALKVGGVGEVVIHNKTGKLVNTRDASIFGDVVANLLVDENEKNLMGEQAREFVKKNYNLVEGAKQFITIFEKNLSKY